jgi:hypothetical protein
MVALARERYLALPYHHTKNHRTKITAPLWWCPLFIIRIAAIFATMRKHKKDLLAARLTRGSQPGRRRMNANRFSQDNQPKRPPGRPRGATNLMTRDLKEAILGGCSDCGMDGKGTDGLRGYMKRLAMEDTKTMGTLLRAILRQT